MQSPGDIITLIEPYITGPLPTGPDRAGDMRLLIDPLGPLQLHCIQQTNNQSLCGHNNLKFSSFSMHQQQQQEAENPLETHSRRESICKNCLGNANK